jgi:hypothetical protein
MNINHHVDTLPQRWMMNASLINLMQRRYVCANKGWLAGCPGPIGTVSYASLALSLSPNVAM